MRLLLCVYLLGICACITATAAEQPPAIDDAFVRQQFGESCALVSGPAPMIADLDGDGVADIALAARCTNPMADQAEHSYRVVDPYNAFFGYGDPKITTTFASEDPERRGLVLLVIHGSGRDAWRSATPKAKFMIVNLPYKQVAVKKLMVRKKSVMAIYAEETGGNDTVSATFWDGKKYRYQPLGSSME